MARDNAKYYQEHKEEIDTRNKLWRHNHRRQSKVIAHRRWLKDKSEILTYYGGGKCVCVICGENRLACLTIDHINNDGAQHRKNLGLVSGKAFYHWLKINNFPEGFQTLCGNCQLIKRAEEYERGIGY